jgi:lipopolysaccharide transport system permease protein
MQPTPPDELSLRVYTPDSAIRNPGALVRGLIRDIQAGRELAWRLFVRDLSAQYRQTFLGYIWAFLPPLVASLTFIFLQSQGITRIETSIPYVAFAMMGTLLWQTFVDAIQSPLNSIQSAKAMLAKINFPREALLLGGLYMVGFNFLIRLVLLIVVMAIWKVAPGPGLMVFPFAMLGLALCGFAVGMLILPIGTLYGDVGKSVPIAAQFWMLLTPVVYPARTEGFAGWLATWNPISPLITTARESLGGGNLTQLNEAGIVMACALLISFLGLMAFRIVMPKLIERMGG